MIKTEQLKDAYQELINVLELVDDNQKDIIISEDISDKELIEKIQEAGGFLKEGLDRKEKLSVSPETLFVFRDTHVADENLTAIVTLLTKVKSVEKEKPAKGKGKKPVVPPVKVIKEGEDLADIIDAAKNVATLVKLANENIIFQDILGDLKKYKFLDDLKDFMLDTLDEIAKKNIEESSGNKKTELEGVVPLNKDKVVSVKESIKFENISTGITSVKDIVSKSPFNKLFAINPDTLQAITNSMEDNGYDPAFPVVLWGDILIDGNTRLQAAIESGIKEIPMLRKEFDSEKDALEYAIHNQRNRRNITEAEILHRIELLDKPMSKKEAGKLKGSKDESKSNFEIKTASEKSHVKTAKVLGVGASKVSDARTVLKDKKAKKEVESGKKTISKAAKEVREKKSAEKPNKETKGKLEMIPVIIDTLRQFKGKTVEIEEIITSSFETLMEANGAKATNANKVEEEVRHTIDVLVAFDWISQMPEDSILIKADEYFYAR